MAEESVPLVAFVAVYDNLGDAEADFEAVKQINDGIDVGIKSGYDAAVVSHDANNKVKINKTHETPTDYGASVGAGVGLATGLVAALFPAIALTGGLVVGTTVAGSALGAITGHVQGGLSRGDLKDFGQTLDEGTAGLVFVGAANMESWVTKAASRAKKVESRPLQGDRRKALEDATNAQKADAGKADPSKSSAAGSDAAGSDAAKSGDGKDAGSGSGDAKTS